MCLSACTARCDGVGVWPCLACRRPEACAVHAGDPAALPVPCGGAWCSNMRATYAITHLPLPRSPSWWGVGGATSEHPVSGGYACLCISRERGHGARPRRSPIPRLEPPLSGRSYLPPPWCTLLPRPLRVRATAGCCSSGGWWTRRARAGRSRNPPTHPCVHVRSRRARRDARHCDACEQ